jgi:hypothetical protein
MQIGDAPRARIDESLLAPCAPLRAPVAGEAALQVIDRQAAAYEACAAKQAALAAAARVIARQ